MITCQLHVRVKTDLRLESEKITPLYYTGGDTVYLWKCAICQFLYKKLFCNFIFLRKKTKSYLFVFFSSLSISPSWECRIKILELPIQTLPSSSKQKSIQAPLCKNVQRNRVPREGSLSVSILVYLDLGIYPSDRARLPVD